MAEIAFAVGRVPKSVNEVGGHWSWLSRWIQNSR